MPGGWTFELLAPGWLVACGLALAVAMLLVSARRHWPRLSSHTALLVVRVVFLLLLGWILLLPARRHPVVEKVPPRFVVALDNSASMAVEPAVPGAVSRWSAACKLLESSGLRKLAGRTRVDVVPLSGTLGTPVPLKDAAVLRPDGKSSPLGDELRAVVEQYKGQPLAGILFISDGLDTGEPEGGWGKGSWPCPLYTVRLDPATAAAVEPQLRMESLDTPRSVLQGWDTRLTAVVSGQGTKGQSVLVRLSRNGVIAEETRIRLPPEGGRREVPFRLQHPDLGTETWTVEAVPLPGERQTTDNRLAAVVRVGKADNRLLYVESVPRWESKYLNRELQGNRSLRPVSVLRGPDGGFLSYGDAKAEDIRLTPAGLAAYRIVILGDLDAATLGRDRAAALLAFVENGGGLILLGGARAWGAGGFAESALAPLLPFHLTGGASLAEGTFPVRWTAEGLAHPAFAAEADRWVRPPPVLSLFGGTQPVPAAVTLAVADTPSGTQPLILARQYGTGHVVALLTDSLWRWQLQSDESRPYSRFWSRITEWMLPEAARGEPFALELSADTDRAFLNDTVNFQARLSLPPGEPAPSGRLNYMIRTPAGGELPLEMRAVPARGGLAPCYAATFTPAEPGQYRAIASVEVGGRHIESAPCLIQVQPFTPENEPRPANEPLLRMLAESSHGFYGTPDVVEKALAVLNPPPETRERLEYESLWQRPWLLLSLLALVITDWVIRRRRGMP